MITLCGSMRFRDDFERLEADLTLAGHVVLAPTALAPTTLATTALAPTALAPTALAPTALAPTEELTVEERARLGRIHLQKVAMADEVLVINVGDHIGESTTREIEHAVSLGIPVRYLEPHAPDGADD